MKKSVSLIWRSWQQYCYKHQHKHFYLFLTNAHCPFNTSHWLWDDASLFSSLPQFLRLLFETLTFWQVLAALETVSQVSFAWCFCCCLFFCLFSSQDLTGFVSFGRKLQKKDLFLTHRAGRISRKIFMILVLITWLEECLPMFLLCYYFLILCSWELSQLVHFARGHGCLALLLKKIVHIYSIWRFSVRKKVCFISSICFHLLIEIKFVPMQFNVFFYALGYSSIVHLDTQTTSYLDYLLIYPYPYLTDSIIFSRLLLFFVL